MPPRPSAQTDKAPRNPASSSTWPELAEAGWWIARSSALILAVAAVAACTATSESVSGGESDIYGGVDDNDGRGASNVVALKIESGEDTSLCSGVLVAPNVVLTARHCVAIPLTTSPQCDEHGQSRNGKHVAGDRAPGDITVYTGVSPKFGGQPDAAVKSIVAPKGDTLCDSDIALVVLDRRLESLTPASVRLDAAVAVGERIRSVGYGRNDGKLPIGTRFRKTGVEVLAMGSGVSASKTPLGPHEFEVGRSTCVGDSGGPALSEDTGAVVGVVSRGGQCDVDFGHVYTTTMGWGSLFDDAFAIAGGAPTIETNRPEEPTTAPSEPAPAGPSAAPAAPSASSCALGGAPRSGTSSAALVFGCAAVALLARGRARRRRTG